MIQLILLMIDPVDLIVWSVPTPKTPLSVLPLILRRNKVPQLIILNKLFKIELSVNSKLILSQTVVKTALIRWFSQHLRLVNTPQLSISQVVTQATVCHRKLIGEAALVLVLKSAVLEISW